MQELPFSEDELKKGLQEQAALIENSLMPFLETVAILLENSWHIPGLETKFYYYSQPDKETSLGSLEELKSLLLRTAQKQYESRAAFYEAGTVGLGYTTGSGTDLITLKVYIGIRLYQGRVFKLQIGKQETQEFIIELKDKGSICFSDLPKIFSRLMMDMWCEALEQLPQAFPLIKRQRYWFDDSCFVTGDYWHPWRVWRRVINEIGKEAVEKVIQELKKVDYAILSGDDSDLTNTWEEICVQVQQEESFYWNAYEVTVENFCFKVTDEMPEYKQTLLTHECEKERHEQDEEELEFLTASINTDVPAVSLWLKDKVLQEAMDYRNENIEKHLYGEFEEEEKLDDEDDFEDEDEN